MEPADLITRISKDVLAIQANPLKEELSLTIQKVQDQLDEILADASCSDFSMAVPLQFSLLATIKDRIGTEAYQKMTLAKIKEIAKKKLPDEDEQHELRLYLSDLRKRVVHSS